MQKGFILIFGALLGSYLPATAQTRPAQVYPMQEHNASIMRLMAAAPTHLPVTGSLLIQPLEEPPARFNILPGAAYTFDQSLEHLSPVEVVKTTFVRQASVIFLQLWGGRLQLSGFQSRRQLGNAVVGFSGSGGPLGSHSVTQAGYQGVRMLSADRIYGISLTVSLGRGVHTGHRVEAGRCLAWIWNAGHGEI